MEIDKITQLKSAFEAVVNQVEGVEFWFARDLQILLDYKQWRRFEELVEKAKLACQKSGEVVENHFAKAGKMVKIGSNTEREIKDYMLSRYACYLIAQNGDPRKEAIAFAQSYFALQTRKQELLEEYIKLNQRVNAKKKLTTAEEELFQTISHRGVDKQGFIRIKNKGTKVFFGGATAKEMKENLDLPMHRSLNDFLPTVSLTAKQLATEITNINTNNNDLQGEDSISKEHITNNQAIRDMLIERGVKPEDLPAEKDLKQVAQELEQKRQLQSDKK